MFAFFLRDWVTEAIETLHGTNLRIELYTFLHVSLTLETVESERRKIFLSDLYWRETKVTAFGLCTHFLLQHIVLDFFFFFENCSMFVLVCFCMRSWDSLLVRVPDSWTKGCKFKSQQEQQENVLFQSQLCVLTLIWCPFHPHFTAVARKRPQSFCQKCKWQVTSEYAYTLNPTKSEWADYATVQT